MFLKKKKEEYKDFREKTFAELDAEVEQAIRAERIKVVKKILLVLFVFALLMPDAFLFWFRFGIPPMPTDFVSKSPNVFDVPTQQMLREEESFTYKTLENRGEYELVKMAKYRVAGKLVAKNFYFWGNYLPFGDRPYQSAALIDIGLVWGDLADKDVLSYYRFVSAKTTIARTLYPRLKMGVRVAPYSWREIDNQLSHTHVIPANNKVMSALMYAPKKSSVQLEGYLVDMKVNGRPYLTTSLSRDDNNQNARGGGACEVMYVEKVQINGCIYE